ncbi:MAG: DUF3501 family protein [Deltaproteobacteria bacterium]|nr:MAG: DUF3501 family protein [Deltaproteobacteria bacterium]
MEKITIDDIKDLTTYEIERPEFRKEIIALKKIRRVPLGDRVSLVFENRKTVLFQIQEMLRAERIVLPEKVQEEIDVYNELIPPPNHLSATLFIEIREQARIKEYLDAFLGLDQGERIYFEIDGATRSAARFEAGRSKEDRISAVHYLQFPFEGVVREKFLDPSLPAHLVLDHPNYQARTGISPALRRSLIEDLTL